MKPHTPSSRNRAYILMEVMLAAGIFAMAGVGLAVSLNNIAQTYLQARQLSSIRMELAFRLKNAQVQRIAQIRETEPKNFQGVIYGKEIAPMEFKRIHRVQNLSSKVPLQGYYRITITAQWMEGGNPQTEKAEVYVYQP